MTQLSFQYQAIDRRGMRTRGVLQAPDRSQAYRQIRAAGLQPVRINAVRAGRSARSKKVTLKDIANLTHQFAVLMEARIPVVDGLKSIAEQEHNPRLRDVLIDVANRISAGSAVTDALLAHRAVFGDVYIETIRAAEKTGNMVSVLQLLSEMLEKQYEMQKGVKGALMYPVCVVIALSGAVTFLMVFIVPRFAAMFKTRGIELPLPTRIMVGGSELLQAYWYLALAGLVAGMLGLRALWRSPLHRAMVDRFLHRIPVVCDLLRGLAISRFSQVLGLSLRSGLSLLEALSLAGRASGRPLLASDAEKMREQVNHGGRLADVLLTCSYFPPFTRRMLTAGEEAGELSKMCTVVTRHYDREVTHLTKNVTTVIEPVMIAGLAGVVLLVALAIFLPMWNMAALVG
jgi:type II secretory pathway component PulF